MQTIERALQENINANNWEQIFFCFSLKPGFEIFSLVQSYICDTWLNVHNYQVRLNVHNYQVHPLPDLQR